MTARPQSLTPAIEALVGELAEQLEGKALGLHPLVCDLTRLALAVVEEAAREERERARTAARKAESEAMTCQAPSEPLACDGWCGRNDPHEFHTGDCGWCGGNRMHRSDCNRPPAQPSPDGGADAD